MTGRSINQPTEISRRRIYVARTPWLRATSFR
jgi:hypothetical protein